MDHGITAFEGPKPVGYFVRTALKVPDGGWAARHRNHPDGTNVYEEVFDFNQLPILNAFLALVPEMAPGPGRSNKGSVRSIGSFGFLGSQQ